MGFLWLDLFGIFEDVYCRNPVGFLGLLGFSGLSGFIVFSDLSILAFLRVCVCRYEEPKV